MINKECALKNISNISITKIHDDRFARYLTTNFNKKNYAHYIFYILSHDQQIKLTYGPNNL